MRAERAEKEIVAYRYEAAGLLRAEELRQRLRAGYELLIADHPLAGARRPRFTTHPTYRFWPVENYLVVYRPRRTAPPVIVTIVDARRDVRRLLG